MGSDLKTSQYNKVINPSMNVKLSSLGCTVPIYVYIYFWAERQAKVGGKLKVVVLGDAKKVMFTFMFTFIWAHNQSRCGD